MPENIRERVSSLRPLFEAEGILLAYLFGSLAEGREAQDVDLAVLPCGENFADLRQKVAEFLGTERLDLVNLKTAPPLLRFEVIRNGRLIYKESDQIENDFELSTLREYRDTAYLRRKQAEMLEERAQKWC